MKRPTVQQDAIYEAVRGGGSHVIVEALAGTGKTTTAVGCLSRGVSGRVGFVAFNRHIAAELSSRLPPSVPAMTLHALGLSAVRTALPNAAIDEAKLTKLARALAENEYPSVRQAAEQIARLCKYTLTDESDAGAVAGLVEHYGVEVDDRDQHKVFRLSALLVSESATQTQTIDFDDMVWLPSRLGLPVDGFDLLLVDEAQDLNKAQQQLALKTTRSGRLVPIGDRHQAIYGFTGADCDGLPNLSRQLEGSRTLPLTVTWRCPSSHVALAQAIVPTLEAAPGAIDGEVATATREEIAAQLVPGDLVICRKNAPILSMTYRLCLAGTPAVMRGRDVGKGLSSLIARLKPDGIKDLVLKVEDYREREEARLRRKDAPASAYDSLTDRCDCLSQLAAQATSLEQLESFIRNVFSDQEKPGAAVVLSSVHRAKGLEAERVFVLDPDSLPLVRRDSKPWQKTQESNLCYVAATRSKRVLTFEGRVPAIFGGRP